MPSILFPFNQQVATLHHLSYLIGVKFFDIAAVSITRKTSQPLRTEVAIRSAAGGASHSLNCHGYKFSSTFIARPNPSLVKLWQQDSAAR